MTSGVRLGTPAVTTRGMNTKDMDQIAKAIALMIDSPKNKEQAKGIVEELTRKYPLEG